MKIAYICHPIGGNTAKNIQKVTKIVRDINLTMPDVVPFAPYIADVLALDDDDPEERDRGLQNCTEILKSGMVNELWIYGKRISPGMQTEIHLAYVMEIPILVMDPQTEVPIAMRNILNKGF
jgi:hypothetical protein